MIAIYEKLIEYGIYLLAFLTPLIFLKNTKVNFLLPKEAFLSFMIPLLIWIWLCKEISIGRARRRYNPILIPLLIFTISLFTSWYNSPNLSLSIMATMKSLNYILAFLLIFYNVRKMRVINNTMILLIVSGGLVSVYGILQYFRIDPFFRVGEVQGNVGKMEVFSTFGNPNFLSPYLAATLPVAIAFFFHFLRRPLLAVLCVLMSVLIFSCLILSFARSSWVAMMLSFSLMGVLLFYFKPGELRLLFTRKFLASALIFILLVAGIPVGMALTRGKTSGKGLDSIAYYFRNRFTQMGNVWARFMMWEVSLRETMKHPIIGRGVLSLKVLYPEMQGDFYKLPGKYERYARNGVAFRHSHNDYVQTFFEQGIIGIGSFLAMIAVFLWQIMKLSKYDRKYFFLYLGFAGGALGVLGDALTNFPFRRAAPQLSYFIFLAFTAVRYNQVFSKDEEEEPVQTELDPSKLVLMAILLLPTAWMIKEHSFDYLRGNQYLKAGYVAMVHFQNQSQAIDFFKESARLQPEDPELWYWWAAAYQSAHDMENAEKTYTEALRYGRNNLIFYQLGIIYLQTGREELAEKFLRKSVEIIPLFADGYLQLGSYYLSKGRPADAIKDLRKIEELNCRDEGNNSKLKSRYLLSRAYYLTGSIETSIAELKKYIPGSPQSERLQLFGLLYQQLEQLKQPAAMMAATMEAVLPHMPTDPNLHERTATMFYTAQNYRKAIEYWDPLLNYPDKIGKILYNIAACQYQLQDLAQASETIKRCLLYEPDMGKALELKAMIDSHASQLPVPKQEGVPN